MSLTSSDGSISAVNCRSDGEVRAEIVRLVDSMTSTGQRILNDKSVRALKQLCRYVCVYVKHLYLTNMSLIRHFLLLFRPPFVHLV